jgi:threonylcarbamoyladenosine tRNA methylthiotransferase MtaB
MNVYLDMVGCRLNQAEIEQMARQLRAAGHTIVATSAEADAVIVNTCMVTAQAASDSRQKIRQAARAGAEKILVTGCWSTIMPMQAAELPNVLRVIPNQQKDNLVQEFLGIANPLTDDSEANPANSAHFDLEPISRQPIPGLRQRTRAFIKVQDGCDNACTFCITTVARGSSISRPAVDVVSDIQAALAGGTREIVLTGVHLGSWGQDFNQHLGNLVAQILHETDTPRLRLSSLEPWDLGPEFFSLWENPRLCPHLHLPLQSGSAATLKRMLRKTSPVDFAELVNSARRLIPGVAITTDLIAGFPGESETEFLQTLEFVKSIQFSGGHVFTYSARPGTPAARIKEQVPHETRKQRNHLLQETLKESAQNYRESFLGQTFPVLWEASARQAVNGWEIEGLTANYLRVTATSAQLRWNHIDEVKLTGITEEGVCGEIIAMDI